ncbi:WD40/YVTN/BNR-like repeat-containing protein [Gemmatimonadota bacterium]
MSRWIPVPFSVLAVLVLCSNPLPAQEPLRSSSTFGDLPLRSLGPALVSGRISDVAVDPRNRSIWYVGVSAGNVWKTMNRGTTWEPIFDDYGSYSIGAVTVDTLNPDIVWVGTGENASQRSAGYGDGIYKSTDGGETFRHMGLANSEHIGDILVDPRNSDVVYAASQGPLWASGGDRGLYKTTNGGESWERILHVSDDTGIADIVFDAADPDIIYASSYQRRRHVGILVAGGPEGKIFKSTNAGASWTEVMNGIPRVDLGRIALEVSPHQPGVVYALVAAQDEESGFFRSADYGRSWTRQSDYIVVDPQYYGELFADPHRPGRLCAVDVNIHCTEDEGVTFEPMRPQGVHVDHHEIVFDPVDPNYMLIGNDGGLYESFDGGGNWRHIANLPITQFYRVGIDNTEPFYWVYGGTQDNGTPGGPSGTRIRAGVMNADWIRVVGGDGFQARVDPSDPFTVYGMSQGARIVRLDKRTGVSTSIAPPHADEFGDTIYWHWDIPFVISLFDDHRVYALGSRLARSDNQGDDWRFISPNLTRQIDRDTLPVMGRIWPENAVWKNVFTNDYGIGVAFSESPFDESLLYAGTDDGLIQVTEDGGYNWRRISSFPGIPSLIYVSAVLASRHHPDRVYALFNNHKRGDFTPYVLRSDDRGGTWRSIVGNLPDRHVVWDLVEDPGNEDLLFLGTEFGLFFSQTGGGEWTELTGNAPTIPFRDMEIHQGMGDLVAATFGRGFYVLDDYTPLRGLARAQASSNPTLFPPRTTYLYDRLGYYSAGSGAGNFTAENPPFGAILNYYLPGGMQEGDVVLVVRDVDGTMVREVPGTSGTGLQRVVWDLSGPPPEVPEGGGQGQSRRRQGPPVAPGTYLVTLEVRVGDEVRASVGPEAFRVVRLESGER